MSKLSQKMTRLEEGGGEMEKKERLFEDFWGDGILSKPTTKEFLLYLFLILLIVKFLGC